MVSVKPWLVWLLVFLLGNPLCCCAGKSLAASVVAAPAVEEAHACCRFAEKTAVEQPGDASQEREPTPERLLCCGEAKQAVLESESALPAPLWLHLSPFLTVFFEVPAPGPELFSPVRALAAWEIQRLKPRGVALLRRFCVMLC